MALKAGYVGVKRWLYEKLTKESADNKQSISDLHNTIDLFNVKNILPQPQAATKEDQGITFTKNDDGSVSISGTTSATALWRYNVTLPKGTYIISGRISASVWIGLYVNATNTYKVNTASADDVKFTVDEDTTYGMTIRVGHPNAFSEPVKIYPMIRLAEDSNNTYQPYAMTNQQLTAEAVTLESVDEAHKNVINGIISAATGAADFAAFKTAMAALTPLTRSAAPAEETRGTVEIDEPVTTTKTTKKTTK